MTTCTLFDDHNNILSKEDEPTSEREKSMKRVFLLARYLQKKLDDNTPTSAEFLKFRDEIIDNDCEVLKEDLAHERELFERLNHFQNRFEEIKSEQTNPNKMELVTLSAQLKVTDKELKEATRCLNRRFLEQILIQRNSEKIYIDIAWIKNRLDEDEITKFIQDCKVSHAETIFEKKEITKSREKKVLEDIRGLKSRIEQLVLYENQLQTIKERIERCPEELDTLRNGTDIDVVKRGDMRREKVEKTKSRYQNEENYVKSEIDLSRTELINQRKEYNILVTRLHGQQNDVKKSILDFELKSVQVEGHLQKILEDQLLKKEFILKEIAAAKDKIEEYDRKRTEKIVENQIREAREKQAKEAALIISQRLRVLYKVRMRTQKEQDGKKLSLKAKTTKDRKKNK